MRGKSIVMAVLAAAAAAFAEPTVFYDLSATGPEPGGKPKRYRASIRQHQRHAAKARNKARSR